MPPKPQQVYDLVELGYMALRRRRKAQFAYAVTRVVYADHVGEMALEALNLDHVVEKLNNVHNLFRSKALVVAVS